MSSVRNALNQFIFSGKFLIFIDFYVEKCENSIANRFLGLENSIYIKNVRFLAKKWVQKWVLLGRTRKSSYQKTLKGHWTRLRICRRRFEMHLTTLTFDRFSEKLIFDPSFRWKSRNLYINSKFKHQKSNGAWIFLSFLR